MPFQSILVTGADGFVGRTLVPRLAGLMPEAKLTLCARGMTADAVGTVVPLDLTDDASVEAAVAIAQPDLVVHLAAQSSVAGSATGAASTWQINVSGSMRLAAAIAKLPIPATMLFASSVEVYGLTFNEGCLDEDAARRPQSAYARSKTAAEDALTDLLPVDARLITTRACNHSGPGQDTRFVLAAFAEQIAAIERGKRAPVLRVGNLSPERDFLHVDDVVAAYLSLIAAAPALPTRSVFNVASGKPVAIGSLLDQMLAQSEIPISLSVDPDRLRANDVSRVCASPARLQAATGWQPSRTHVDMLYEILLDKRRVNAIPCDN